MAKIVIKMFLSMLLTSILHVPPVSMLLASLVMLNGGHRGGFFCQILTLMMDSSIKIVIVCFAQILAHQI